MKPRARVVRGAAAAEAKPLFEAGPSLRQWRRIARDEIEGRLQAEEVLCEARAEAESWLERARVKAAGDAASAENEARERAQAELAAQWLLLRREEQERMANDSERVITLAVALAERLLGAELELQPAKIADLARSAIAEARGARRAVLGANPLDSAALRQHLTLSGLDVLTVEIRDDAALARGELRLHTEIGTIDARLAPRFERLAAALRSAVR